MDEKLDTLIDKLSLLLIAPVDKKTNFTFKRTATALKSSNESKPIIKDNNNNNNTKKNTNKIIQKECDNDNSSTKCCLLLKNIENPTKKYESKVMVMPNNIADEVKIIHGIPLAADLKSNYYLKLDSNNGQQPLTIMDLEKEGLSEYLPYIKNPTSKTNQAVSFNNHISVSSLNSSNSTTTTSSSSSSSRSYKSVRSNNKSINSYPILKNKITKTKSDPQPPRHTITNNNKSTNNKKDVIKQVSFKELNNNNNNNNNTSQYSISTIAENIFINPTDKSTPLPSTPLPPPLNYVLSKISSLHNQNNTLDTVPNTPAAYSTPIPNIREQQQTPELVLPVVSLPPLPLPMSKTPPTKSIIIPKSINKSKLVTPTFNYNSKPPSNKTQADTSLKQVCANKLILYYFIT